MGVCLEHSLSYEVAALVVVFINKGRQRTWVFGGVEYSKDGVECCPCESV